MSRAERQRIATYEMRQRIRARVHVLRKLPLQYGYEALGDIGEAEERMWKAEELRASRLAVTDWGEGGGASTSGAATPALRATCAGLNGETYVLRAAVPTLDWLAHRKVDKDIGLVVRLSVSSATCTCHDFADWVEKTAKAAAAASKTASNAADAAAKRAEKAAAAAVKAAAELAAAKRAPTKAKAAQRLAAKEALAAATAAAAAAPSNAPPPKRGCCKHVLALLLAWCMRADDIGVLPAALESVSDAGMPANAASAPALAAAAAALARSIPATPARAAAAGGAAASPPTLPHPSAAPPQRSAGAGPSAGGGSAPILIDMTDDDG